MKQTKRSVEEIDLWHMLRAEVVLRLQCFMLEICPIERHWEPLANAPAIW